MNAIDFFYLLKPFIPKQMQLAIRRSMATFKRQKSSGLWPIWPIAGETPKDWKGWPDNKKFALVLIHDVDTKEGRDNILNLMELETRLGFRSAFFFVPEDYDTPNEIRQRLANSGFEIGLHGLTHDGKAYRNYNTFSKLVPRVNRHIKEWGVVGYTSPSMLGNLRWNSELNIEYSCSSFDTDPFEPRPYGVATIFPFLVSNESGSRFYVEIPYTLPQDHSLFVLLRENNIDIWKRKLDWVAKKGGVALINTHPDYMSFETDIHRKNRYPSLLYKEFLEYVASRYGGCFWNCLPNELARFWRAAYPGDAKYDYKGTTISASSRVAIFSRKAKYDWRIKLALTCAAGGHFEQMQNLEDLYSKWPHFWITVRTAQTEQSVLNDKAKYFITYAHFKKPWTYIQQIPQVLRIFRKEQPTHILSTGSGIVGFIPFLLSILLKIKFIHIETFSHVCHPTKLGKFLLSLNYPIHSQWGGIKHKHVTNIGPVISSRVPLTEDKVCEELVFVTLGTRPHGFPRLLRTVEALILDNIITEKVVAQIGSTNYRSDLMQTFDFCSPDDIDKYIASSKYIITQESAGIVTKCMKAGKRFIVMPRDYKYKELPTKSDMREDLHLKLKELGFTYVVHDREQLKEAILNISRLKAGFDFDNSRAIAYLKNLLTSA